MYHITCNKDTECIPLINYPIQTLNFYYYFVTETAMQWAHVRQIINDHHYKVKKKSIEK